MACASNSKTMRASPPRRWNGCPGATSRRATSASTAAKFADLKAIVDAASLQHQIDADFIASVIRAESGGNPNAVSRKGARGLMQLMPPTATAVAKQLGIQVSLSALTSDAGNNIQLTDRSVAGSPGLPSRHRGRARTRGPSSARAGRTARGSASTCPSRSDRGGRRRARSARSGSRRRARRNHRNCG